MTTMTREERIRNIEDTLQDDMRTLRLLDEEIAALEEIKDSVSQEFYEKRITKYNERHEELKIRIEGYKGQMHI